MDIVNDKAVTGGPSDGCQRVGIAPEAFLGGPDRGEITEERDPTMPALDQVANPGGGADPVRRQDHVGVEVRRWAVDEDDGHPGPLLVDEIALIATRGDHDH